MQGHRGAVGSSAGTIDFDHGAAPSSAVISADMFWNGQLLPEILPSSTNTGAPHYVSAGAGGQNLSLWCQGEASSSSMQNAAACSEQKMENGWASGALNSETVTGFEDWFNTPINLSLDNNIGRNHIGNRPLALEGCITEANHQNLLYSSANASPQNLNLNVRASGQPDDHIQYIEAHNSYRSGYLGSGQTPVNAATATHSFISPGNGSHSMGDNVRRFDSSHDSRRLPCKRKFIDEDVGQSSASGSAGSYQHSEGSSWHPITVDNSDSSSNIIGSHGRLHPICRRSSGTVSETLPDISHVDNRLNIPRNIRLRLGSVQPSASVNIGSAGSAFTPANDSRLQHPEASLPTSLSFVAAPEVSNQQAHPAAANAVLPRNSQSFRRSRGSASRAATSSAIVIGEQGDAQNAEASLRMSRLLLERHMRAHHLIQASRGRSVSASRGGSNSAVIIPPDPTSHVTVPDVSSEPDSGSNIPAGRTWGPGHNFASGQRIAEMVRRSLVAAGGSDHASSSNDRSLPTAGAATSRQPIPVPGINGLGTQLAHRRLALLMQRRGNGLPGVPYSLQNLGAAGDDRSRLISEIWSALDSMRRGEPLRAEDIMVLDQSGLFGMAAELHDRHRDMRLDVDNMSYEELLALEERIGYVSTGLPEEAVMKCLKQRAFAPSTAPSKEETEPCCICQEEYNEGESIGILDCGHNFHTACIKQWLVVKNLCPICKTTGLASQ